MKNMKQIIKIGAILTVFLLLAPIISAGKTQTIQESKIKDILDRLKDCPEGRISLKNIIIIFGLYLLFQILKLILFPGVDYGLERYGPEG